MKEVLRQEIVKELTQVIAILVQKDPSDVEELKKMSDQAVEHVAIHKDLDIISITVLIYSIYKVLNAFNAADYDDLLIKLNAAKDALAKRDLGVYNRNIRLSYELVKKSNAEIKVHLQDVMQAARIKKGTALLERGLSIGQAAGLMGLSNWDLQQYAGKTTLLEPDREAVSALKRLQQAYKIFGVH